MITLEHGVYYGFGRKSFMAKLVKKMAIPLGILFMSAVMLVMNSNQSDGLLIQIAYFGIIGACVLGIVQFIIAYLDHLGTKFMISANALYIRSGIFNRREISVPFKHINNIHQFQSVSDRMLSVATCSIEVMDDEVATSNIEKFSGDIYMHEVDVSLLQPLREAILSHANTQRMYVVNEHNNITSSTEENIDTASRMYDNYANNDSHEYPPYQSL